MGMTGKLSGQVAIVTGAAQGIGRAICERLAADGASLMMADVDVTDIEHEEGMITVFAPHTEYAKARQALQEAFEGLEFEVDEIQFLPQTTTTVEGDDIELFEKFMDMLNDLDDVQNVYHNAVIAD